MVCVREKIRRLNLKLSDLALYMGISRPSLYKYMELYEQNDRKNIPADVRKVFSFISRKGTVSKEQVIVYIVSEIQEKGSDQNKDPVCDYVLSASDEDFKKNFLKAVISSDCLDSVIPYLTECINLSKKNKFGEDDIQQLTKFIIFRNDVEKNKPASIRDTERTKKLLGIV